MTQWIAVAMEGDLFEGAAIAVTPIDGGIEARDPAQNRVRLLEQA